MGRMNGFHGGTLYADKAVIADDLTVQGTFTFAGDIAIDDATFDDVTIADLTVSGTLALPAGSVETADIADLGVTTGKLAAAAVTKAKLAGGFLKFAVIAGQDETSDTTIPLTGLAVGDEIVLFAVLTTAASIASLALRAVADFTVSADTITVAANAADNTNNQYLVAYLDLT